RKSPKKKGAKTHLANRAAIGNSIRALEQLELPFHAENRQRVSFLSGSANPLHLLSLVFYPWGR
ncbi:hypothetical protein, partial [Lacisediminimonas sp.]|uniref:hypothetical protein n=1 Tax=Lacisediminimonas sp. TaxID=3060582 RepID=UPI00271F612E